GADIGTKVSFRNVSADAHSSRELHVATGAAGIGGTAGLGIAITVARVTGDTSAQVGDRAEIGSTLDKVGNVSLSADGTASIKPFLDGGPMGIALSGGLLAGSAGITDARMGDVNGAALTVG